MTRDGNSLQRLLSNVSGGRYQNLPNQKGFTLIEVMIVVVILAILAAIAVPSYRRYIIVNAERDTQAKMLQLQLELERWRASALTYKGFMPKTADSDNGFGYSYADEDNTIINVPTGSGDDYDYRITLVDGDATDKSQSLVTTPGVDNVTGRTWKMLAAPNPNRYISKGSHIMLTSSGIKCMTMTTIEIGSDDCGNSSQAW